MLYVTACTCKSDLLSFRSCCTWLSFASCVPWWTSVPRRTRFSLKYKYKQMSFKSIFSVLYCVFTSSAVRMRASLPSDPLVRPLLLDLGLPDPKHTNSQLAADTSRLHQHNMCTYVYSLDTSVPLRHRHNVSTATLSPGQFVHTLLCPSPYLLVFQSSPVSQEPPGDPQVLAPLVALCGPSLLEHHEPATADEKTMMEMKTKQTSLQLHVVMMLLHRFIHSSSSVLLVSSFSAWIMMMMKYSCTVF